MQSPHCSTREFIHWIIVWRVTVLQLQVTLYQSKQTGLIPSIRSSLWGCFLLFPRISRTSQTSPWRASLRIQAGFSLPVLKLHDTYMHVKCIHGTSLQLTHRADSQAQSNSQIYGPLFSTFSTIQFRHPSLHFRHYPFRLSSWSCSSITSRCTRSRVLLAEKLSHEWNFGQ